MADEITQDNRLISIETPLGKDVLLLNAFTGSERISGFYGFHLDLLAQNHKASSVQAEQLLGQMVTIVLHLVDGSERFFTGIFNRFDAVRQDQRFHYYEAEMVPWTWFLTQTTDCRVFQFKTVPEVIEEVLAEAKFNNVRNALTRAYTSRDYCIQYRETDFNFLSRLAEEEGIFYFFEYDRGETTLVLADSPSAHEECPGQETVRYPPARGEQIEEDFASGWRVRKEIRPGKFVHRDYHFQMPSKTLEATEPTTISVGENESLELFDFPGGYAERFNLPEQRLDDVEPEAGTMAKLRMQDEESLHETVEGNSYCRAFSPGFRFNLEHLLDPGEGGPFVLTTVFHRVEQSPDYVSGVTPDQPYQNSFTCIPHRVPFRPRRVTARPVVQGLQSALVVGPPGEEIYTDKFGRVKVQFPWDRVGSKDENSSCWVRVAQPWAGKRWGFVSLPRIGHEVLVAFLEGDPDNPLVVGSVYNAENMPPYELPGNQTQTGLKSRSSKRGGSDNFNEIRFEDKKGQEQIYLHAEKDWSIKVENDKSQSIDHDKSETIGNDKTITVKGKHTETIQKDRTIEVTDGKHDETIKKDRIVVVTDGNVTRTVQKGDVTDEIQAGDHSENVAKKYKLEATNVEIEGRMDITLKVGGNSIRIDQTGITIFGVLVKIN